MARGITTRLLVGDNNVALLGTQRENAEELAAQLQDAAAGDVRGGIQAGASDDPIEDDVVVLAITYGAVKSVAKQYASELSGKLVDITNPVDWESIDQLVTPPDNSAAEEIAGLFPKAKILKAFNTAFADTLATGEVAGHPLDVFVASDDSETKQKVIGLVEAGGLHSIDAVPLRHARQLEGLRLLYIMLQQSLSAPGLPAQ